MLQRQMFFDNSMETLLTEYIYTALKVDVCFVSVDILMPIAPEQQLSQDTLLSIERPSYPTEINDFRN